VPVGRILTARFRIFATAWPALGATRRSVEGVHSRRWHEMKKIHALLIALILAVSAGLGLAAATRTVGLRTATTSARPQTAAIAARSQRLDRVEASLRRALRDKPPALPAVPAAPRPIAGLPAPQVVYKRPAPIVVLKHGSHHGSDREAEGGGDD
jgi:hypothetical protein